MTLFSLLMRLLLIVIPLEKKFFIIMDIDLIILMEINQKTNAVHHIET